MLRFIDWNPLCAITNSKLSPLSYVYVLPSRCVLILTLSFSLSPLDSFRSRSFSLSLSLSLSLFLSFFLSLSFSLALSFC